MDGVDFISVGTAHSFFSFFFLRNKGFPLQPLIKPGVKIAGASELPNSLQVTWVC